MYFIATSGLQIIVYAAASFVFDSNSRVNSTSVMLDRLAKFEKKKEWRGQI